MLLHQTDRFDLFKNGIDQLEKLKAALVDDLNFYTQKPNPNKAYVDIKQKQIANLCDILQMFTNVYDAFEDEITNVNNKLNESENKLFKTEACAFYYGVSKSEITYFTNRSYNAIVNDIQRCIAEKWRQMPLAFRDLIDYSKADKNQSEIEIIVHKNGDTEYIAPPKPLIKTTTSPIYDWSTLKTN